MDELVDRRRAIKALIVEPDERWCSLLRGWLTSQGVRVMSAPAAAEAHRLLQSEIVDVAVIALDPDDGLGLELCKSLVDNWPGLPVLVIANRADLESAVAAMRAGACDFLARPVELELLLQRIELAWRRGGRQIRRIREDCAPRFEEIIGVSPEMLEVCELIGRVADSNASVLISGETGTGKELVARAIHRRSPRRQRPFVAVSCAAMPEPLLESELFGHARGAFTDAKTAHPGLLIQAERGTVFLDEIGDMPPGIQPKLLRVLQERLLRPLGGLGELPVDFRLIAATNRELELEVVKGRFRADLYFRVNVVQLKLPPLRQRGDDILLLARHFIERFAGESGKRLEGMAPAVARRLMSYRWPGNIRELQNCIESAVALTRYDHLTLSDLPASVRQQSARSVAPALAFPNDLVPMEVVEQGYIRRVMDLVQGNKTLAARILGFNRKTLYRKLERYRILVGASAIRD